MNRRTLVIMLAAVLLYAAACMAALSRPLPADAAPIQASLRLDLNRAAAGDLLLLPGIGPHLAQRIVEQRTSRGPFTSVEQLTAVSGVGPRTFERLSPFVKVEAHE